MKREGYISWGDYFMGIAILSSMRSKDPNTQVGCCIVDNDNRIISIGYNGFPIGCHDDCLPWKKQGDFLDTKYAYVVHSEMSALLSCPVSVKDCIMYTTLFPCNECAKSIIQAGISKLYYLDDKYKDTDSHKASVKMFNLSGVQYEKHIPKHDFLQINFKENK